MKYQALGKSGLKVSQIGFGCGNVGGVMIRGQSRERVRVVARALELGINYFDTAPSYGDGLSEKNLGQALEDLGAEAHVGTKVRVTTRDAKNVKDAVVRSVEESLKRLDRECVDLIQLHNRISLQGSIAKDLLSVGDVLEEVVEAFRSLQAQGKVRFFGITGMGETQALHEAIESRALHSVQTVYNLLNPSAGTEVPHGFSDQDFGRMIDRAGQYGAGIIVIRALAGGALTGMAERHPLASPAPAPIGSASSYAEDVHRAGSFGFLVKEGYVEDLAEAALRFVLSKRGVSTLLVGYSSLEQLERSVEYASRGPLPPQTLARLPDIWGQFVGK